MSTFFKDTLTSSDLDIIRGSLPQVGFVPASMASARAWFGSNNPGPMRRGTNGAQSLADGQRIQYGLDVSDIGGEPGHGDDWVPDSADGWVATWDWYLDYYSATDGASRNYGWVQLGNARTKNILVEFLQIGAGRFDMRIGHGATGYGIDYVGQVRVQCPEITATGKYPARLVVTRDKATLTTGGATVEVALAPDASVGNFNSVVVFLQPSLRVANLEIATGTGTPPQTGAPFWTGLVDTVVS